MLIAGDRGMRISSSSNRRAGVHRITHWRITAAQICRAWKDDEIMITYLSLDPSEYDDITRRLWANDISWFPPIGWANDSRRPLRISCCRLICTGAFSKNAALRSSINVSRKHLDTYVPNKYFIATIRSFLVGLVISRYQEYYFY